VSYPNIPLGGRDWQRRATQAINYTLNELTYLQLRIDDGPLTDGEVVWNDVFPIGFKLVRTSCYATARTPSVTTAVFTILIGGVQAGAITFSTGQTAGVIDITETDLPALTDLEIVAPDPADTILDDLTIIIALKR
jgi:hypothetical protein